ncbi:MAG: cytochrome c biogenesis protein CcdA [Actinomycetia bacterium]|nr:cytochrome c biogenesis protein CcdA [Actinomycetes bacterium]
MVYLFTFLEGIVSFISPCLLPLLPVYVLYFAGEQGEAASGEGAQRFNTLLGALVFIAGFTLVFALLGAFAGTLGRSLAGHRRLLEIVCGAVIVVFGLSYLGVLKIGFLQRSFQTGAGRMKGAGVLRPLVLGLSFALSWSPCIGVFLGSALALAASRASWLEGVILLLCFSLGLGLPFLLAALLIDRLKASIAVVMRHQQLITRVSGALLIVIGLLLAAGWLGTWVASLSRISW